MFMPKGIDFDIFFSPFFSHHRCIARSIARKQNETQFQRILDIVAKTWRLTRAVFSALARVSRKLYAMSKFDRSQWRAQVHEWKQAIKQVANHYWAGTKLLWTEVKIASKYLGKALGGKTLSRGLCQCMSCL